MFGCFPVTIFLVRITLHFLISQITNTLKKQSSCLPHCPHSVLLVVDTDNFNVFWMWRIPLQYLKITITHPKGLLQYHGILIKRNCAQLV